MTQAGSREPHFSRRHGVAGPWRTPVVGTASGFHLFRGSCPQTYRAQIS